MNRADEFQEIVRKLRYVGVSEHQIAVVLGLKHSSYRVQLHHDRRAGAIFPPPAAGVTQHLERAITALVHALANNNTLCAADALLVITAHPSLLGMRDAAAKLISHGIVEPDEVAWLLVHLGCEAIDTTLAA